MSNIKQRIETLTHEHDGIVLSNETNRPVPVDCFEDAGLPVPEGQQAAVDAHATVAIARYKRTRRNRPASDEERYEMRAAFGKGAEVVNVFTGRRTRV